MLKLTSIVLNMCCFLKVCSLNTHTLLSMGVSDFDAEKIMENVSILRQTCFIEPTYNNFDHFDPKIDQRK